MKTRYTKLGSEKILALIVIFFASSVWCDESPTYRELSADEMVLVTGRLDDDSTRDSPIEEILNDEEARKSRSRGSVDMTAKEARDGGAAWDPGTHWDLDCCAATRRHNYCKARVSSLCSDFTGLHKCASRREWPMTCHGTKELEEAFKKVGVDKGTTSEYKETKNYCKDEGANGDSYLSDCKVTSAGNCLYSGQVPAATREEQNLTHIENADICGGWRIIIVD